MQPKNAHIVQLDGIRFFAVLMVMIAHWLQWKWSSPVLTKIPFVHGVTLFFVLSGFLITKILLVNREKYNKSGKSKKYLIKNFYARRFLRIFPIYYLLIFGLLFFNYKNTSEIFVWLVTYTTNIYQSIENVYIGEFNHFWSLAVEEQFYLFWPFLILFISQKRTLRVILLTILVSLLTRVLFFFYVDNWMATAYFTITCMHSLGLGALMAYISIYKPALNRKLSRPVWMYLVLAAYLLLLFAQNYFHWVWYKKIFENFFFAVLAFFIILRASGNGYRGPAKWVLEQKFVIYSGKISYGLYVYHLFMMSLFYYLAPKIGLNVSNKYTLFVLLYVLAFIASHISWQLIESPINSLKKYFPYYKSD